MTRAARERSTLLGAGWILMALYLVWTLGIQTLLAAQLGPFTRNLIEQSLLTGIFLCLAFAALDWAEVLVFAVWCFLLSNLFENLGVETGFPFGFFEHSPDLGPRLFNIPWLATPTYMAMGFISWMVAQVLLDRTARASWAGQVAGASVIAAFVFTMWDFSNDAVFHTVNGAFWYREAGAFFGVPTSNFAGWLLVTFLIYGGFGLILARRAGNGADARRGAWALSAAAYGAVAASSIYRNLNGVDRTVTTKAGVTWETGGIYESMTLVTLFTMVFVTLLAALRLHTERRVTK